MESPSRASAGVPVFSEKAFYLGEFQGRTLAFAVPALGADERPALEAVLAELERNRTRVVLLTPAPSLLDALAGTKLLAASGDGLEGAVWRGFADAPRVGLVVEGDRAFAPACREIALRLGVSKCVWIDPGGGLAGDAGVRSFVDLAELRELADRGFPGEEPRRAALLAEVERGLDAGLPAVNLCTARDVADELFTYAGAGTLFTRGSYVEVRRLGIDDYAAADDLMARGVADGFLAPRSPDGVDRVLAHAFGAFVEGRHLAGIGALLGYESPRSAEIASLYTLTRFVGEGIGGHLVRFALASARQRGEPFVFACTTSERVVGFFEGHGFRPTEAAGIPEARWRGYDPERRERLICLRHDL